MARIKTIEIWMVDLKPKTVRFDAIQSFQSQETPIVKITDQDGDVGYGYTYTIGTGGSSIIALLKDHLAPLLIDGEAHHIERLWETMFYSTHATTTGAITSLSMAALDIALWDLKSRKVKLPLHVLLGGHKERIRIYSSEGGWLHLNLEALVDDALKMKEKGFLGSKIKIGKPDISDDVRRLTALREAVGDSYHLMVDANQSFTLSESIRRANALEGLNLDWFEEPMLADDLEGHRKLSNHTSIPIAVGESLYSLGQFKNYLQAQACTLVQADVARVGGITPWLKVAHLAEAHQVSLCPHFLMEIHLALSIAVSNALWIEYIPQLTDVVHQTIKIKDGYAYPSESIGVGIDWDWEAIKKGSLFDPIKIG